MPTPRRLHFALAAVVTLMLSSLVARAAEGDGAKSAGNVDPEAAIAQFTVPPGFAVSLFAAEPRVSNPSAFAIDERGRFYVVEANRRRKEVLDVRNLSDWVDDDIANRTVADRIAMLKRRLSPGEIDRLRATSDRVRLIEDRDGDGRADHDSVFADKFNAIEDGSAAGVLARVGPGGTDVWFTNIPSLWHLRDDDGDGAAELKKRLHYGYGVRYNFSGHDLHGLRFGPDGLLYFTVADRGMHVETSDGRTIANPDSGAVLRCNPDGSDLELVHTGLRNPQELAFDEFGNLFTCDNNSDGGDLTRWVQVAEGGDSGWRIGYQWHDFPVSRGPWNSERLWDVNPPVPAFYRLPPLANPKIAGPSGLTYAPGVGLPGAFDGRFLLVDFRGSPAGGSGVYALQNKPKGASFELAEVKPLMTNILPSDVEVGYDGGVYVLDWVAGWEPKQQGRIYRVAHAEAAADPAVAEARQILSDGIWKQPKDKLLALLAHRDMRVRQAAQFTLAAAGETSAPDLSAVAAKNESRLARVHAIWALGQMLRAKADVAASLVPLLRDGDEEIRAQAAKVLGEGKATAAGGELMPLLGDKNPRVQYFAAAALGKLAWTDATVPLLDVLRKNADADAYLRHACVVALSSIHHAATLDAAARDSAPVPQASKNVAAAFDAAARDSSPAVRMGVLLALRRLGDAKVASFLHDADLNVVLEATRAINDAPISAAFGRLAAIAAEPPAVLTPPASATPLVGPEATARASVVDAIMARALNANYRLGTPEAAKTLAAVAARDGREGDRLLALQMLTEWAQPRTRDWVAARPDRLSARDVAVARAALAPVLPDLLAAAPDAVRIAALSAGEATGATAAPLADIVADAGAAPGLRAAALGAMTSKADATLATTATAALADKDETVRRAAIRALATIPQGLKRLEPVLATGTPREQQAVLRALADKRLAKSKAVDPMLRAALDRLAAGDLPAEAVLDLLTATATRTDRAVVSRIEAYESARPKGDPLAPFRETLVGGDAARGRQIFRERADVSCMRCHAVGAVGGNAGPDLAGLSKRGTREHVLESIVYPNKTIAPGFESVIVRTKKGDVHAGVLKAEDAKSVQIEVPNEGTVTIRKADIDRRKGGMSGMPEDVAKPLSKDDLRDLVEYLSGL